MFRSLNALVIVSMFLESFIFSFIPTRAFSNHLWFNLLSDLCRLDHEGNNEASS